MDTKRFYITTPIFYPNANLHMGHAYTTTLTDALARYHRLIGENTFFLTGSDENTQKMIDAAKKVGQDPMEFLDDTVKNFTDLYSSLDISYDQFIRTTDQRIHWPGAQALWQKLVESGDIYKRAYEGLYCVGHEAFITEKDLVDGKCPDHATKPQRLKEENYFFKLSRYASEIKTKIESSELHVVPENRKNEILSFISQGLEDVSFSRPRKEDWPESLGIPVPGDPSHVMYVWCDALSNYITAVGYGRDEKEFVQRWPADVHVIGKDILRFHAAIWPGMLLSAGLPLPRSILVHGFITSGGQKMSKSLGNVIDPLSLITGYGSEAVRYYLLRHISPFEDGDLTEEKFKEAYNANLANGLGNLVSRSLTMSSAYGVSVSGGREVSAVLSEYPDYGRALEAYECNRAADLVWAEISSLDAFIQENEPYKTIKTNPEKAKKDVSYLLEKLSDIAILLTPLLPRTAQKINDALRRNEPLALFPRKE